MILYSLYFLYIIIFATWLPNFHTNGLVLFNWNPFKIIFNQLQHREP